MKKEFDFENEGNLNNTISIFQELLFTDEDKNKVSLTISNIENILPHAKVGLTNLYDFKPNNREEIYNRLEYEIKEVRRLIDEKVVDLKKERLEILNMFQNIVREIFNKPLINTNKLIINANNSVIYDLIKQLKVVCVNGKTPFLTQSNEEIAKFLINSVEGFEETSVNTIAKEISRKEKHINTKLEVKVIH